MPSEIQANAWSKMRGWRELPLSKQLEKWKETFAGSKTPWLVELHHFLTQLDAEKL